jgi:hypothetical protein
VAGAWLDPRRGTLGALLQGLAEELDGGDGRALDEAAGLAGVSQAALCGLLPRLRAARRIVAVADLDERVESGPAELVQLGALLRQLGRGSRSARLVLLRDDACGAGAALLGQERDLHPLLRAGHLHGAILVGADPLACVEIAPALRELSALVVLDAWPSTSARAARVLLPIPGPLEIEGTLLACDLAVRALVPSAAPPARRDLYAVLAGLAAALGAPDLPGDPALLRADLCAQEGFDPELLERLRAAGGRWPGRTPPASTSSLPVPPRPHPAATRRSRLQELVSARAREQSWGPAYRSAP